MVSSILVKKSSLAQCWEDILSIDVFTVQLNVTLAILKRCWQDFPMCPFCSQVVYKSAEREREREPGR